MCTAAVVKMNSSMPFPSILWMSSQKNISFCFFTTKHTWTQWDMLFSNDMHGTKRIHNLCCVYSNSQNKQQKQVVILIYYECLVIITCIFFSSLPNVLQHNWMVFYLMLWMEPNIFLIFSTKFCVQHLSQWTT